MNTKYFISTKLLIFLLFISVFSFGQHYIEDVSYSSGEYKNFYNDSIISPNDTSKSVIYINTSQVSYKAPVIVIRKGFNSNSFTSGGYFKASYPFQVNFEVEKSCEDTYGRIETDIYGGVPPYTYLWNTTTTDSYIDYNELGIYSVVVTDSRGKICTNEINIESDVLTNVIWTDKTGITETTNTITKTESDAWGNAGAASENMLLTGEDGFIEYFVSIDSYDDNSSFQRALGLSESNTNANYNTIDYGFYFKNDTVFIYESGVEKTNGSKYFTFDKFKIKRKGDSILYIQNSDPLYYTTAANISDMSLIADVALYDQNSYFTDIKMSCCVPVKLYASYSIDGYCHGTISLSATGGTPPYTFTWEDSGTEQTRSNLEIGEYTIIVTDANGITDQLVAELLVPVEWTDFVHTEQRNDTLFHHEASNWISGAASTNKLAPYQDGFVKYTITQSSYDHHTGTCRFLGLSDENTNANLNTIDHAWYFTTDRTARIYENGVQKVYVGGYSPDDIYEIKREGDTIQYLKNGVIRRQIATNEGLSLIVDAEIRDSAAYFDSVFVSFCTPTELIVDYTTTKRTDTELGTISLDISGGIPPYIIAWGTHDFPTIEDIENMFDTIPFYDSIMTPLEYYEKITQRLTRTVKTNLKNGKYKCLVIDQVGQRNPFSYAISSPVHVKDSLGLEFHGDTLIQTGDDGWGNSVMTLYTPTSNELYYSINIKTLEDNVEYALGFRSKNNDPITDYNGLKYGYYFNGNTITPIIDGVLNASINFNINDNIELTHSENGEIVMLKNDSIIYSDTSTVVDTFLTDISVKECITKTPFIFEASLRSYIILNGISTDVSSCGNSDGQIEIFYDDLNNNVYEIELLNMYTDTPVDLNSSDDLTMTNLEEGKYKVIIHYYDPYPWTKTSEKLFWIGHDVTWGMKDNVSVNPTNENTLVYDVTTPGDAVATSWLEENEPGFAEFTFTDKNYIPSASGVTYSEMIHITFGFTLNPNVIHWDIDDYIDPEYMIKSNFIAEYFNYEPIDSRIYIEYNGGWETLIFGEWVNASPFKRTIIVERDHNNNVLFYIDGEFANYDSYDDYIIPDKLFLMAAFNNVPNQTYSGDIEENIELARYSFPCSFTDYSVYTSLKKKLDGSYYMAKAGSLKFKFTEEYNPGDNTALTYHVYNINTPSDYSLQGNFGNHDVKYGDNRFDLDVSSLVADQYYILEVANQKNEKWYLRFKVLMD